MNPIAATPVTPKWLLNAVDLLAANRSHQSRLALPPYAAARRVGRNEVWEIVAPSISPKRYYAKFWSSATFFERELKGHEVVNAIAGAHQWLMPSPLLFGDASLGAIVTEELPGVPFQVLLSGALRRCTRPTKRRAFYADACKCLSLVLRFLDELHTFKAGNCNSLADIRPDAVIRRVNQLALRIRGNWPFRRALPELRMFPIELPSAPALLTSPDVVLYGDLSPANVTFDGARIGLFDFENMGLGPACRDHMWIEYLLEQTGMQWQYRTAGSFLRMLPKQDCSQQLRLLFRLKFSLIHLNVALSRRERQSLPRRLSDHLEIRRVIGQLRDCCCRIEKAGWLRETDRSATPLADASASIFSKQM